MGALEEGQSRRPFEQILVFGNWIVGSSATSIAVWKTDTYEHYTSICPSAQNGKVVFTGKICTLPTYLNKIFVGRSDGNVEIYNISTAKLVHTIIAPSSSTGGVTAISAATAMCVLAVAYADGSLHLYDVDTDEAVLSLQTRSGQPVSTITFRSDSMGAGEDGRKDGAMATASAQDGDITLWDLNRGGRITGVVRSAHETSSSTKASGITKIEFLPGQPVLVSSGLDNAIRSWAFDQSPFTPIPRLLHSRGGHAAPVTELMFLPAASDGSEASGKWLLSAGSDRSLWGFSLRKDGQNTELSQGNVKHKAKKTGMLSADRSAAEDFKATPIISMACCLNRDGGMGAVSGQVWSNTKTVNAEESSMQGWESVVTAHANDKIARTWSWGRKKAGRWAFETGDHQPVTSVAMTACGTFALVGSVGGSLDMFNLQSGSHRQRFPPRVKPAQAKLLQAQQHDADALLKKLRGHKDAITGIVVDNLNATVISSSLDGSVIFWDFTTGRVAHRIRLDSASALAMKYNSVSGLIALSCDDLCIRIIDIESHRIVRELWGCVGQTNDLCFSHDGRWIVACSMDSVTRVFDLSTGHLIDAFRTETCTNVAFSSTGEYLATTHAGALGINVWTNKSLYTHVSPRQVDEDSGVIDLTSSHQFESTTPSDVGQYDMAEETSPDNSIAKSAIDQLDSSLLTLSILPRSRWQTLLNLEAIRHRNKPIQPPEKPKAAPFFLSSALAIGSSDKSATDTISGPTKPPQESSRITALSSLSTNENPISTLLTTSTPSSVSEPHPLIQHLLTLSPSSTHLSLQTLVLSELPPIIRIMIAHLRTHRDYEVVNTWMSVLLRLHADFITETDDNDLRAAVTEWQGVNAQESRRLDEMVGYVDGVVGGWLRSGR